MPKRFCASFVLETLCGVRDKKNSSPIFSGECQRAPAEEMALCLPHGAERQFQILLKRPSRLRASRLQLRGTRKKADPSFAPQRAQERALGYRSLVMTAFALFPFLTLQYAKERARTGVA
jgi:hypothetical protein